MLRIFIAPINTGSLMSKLLNVLVLDDDKDLSFLLITVLKHYSITALQCNNTEEAEALIRQYRPRLLISDMLLPGSDGRDFCSYLKGKDEFRDLNILLMTAYPNAEDSCLAAGADDFTSKPFDMDELIEKIRKLII